MALNRKHSKAHTTPATKRHLNGLLNETSSASEFYSRLCNHIIAPVLSKR